MAIILNPVTRAYIINGDVYVDTNKTKKEPN